MTDVFDAAIEFVARVMEGCCLHMLFGSFNEQKIKKKLTGFALTILTWFAVSKAIRFFVFWDSSFSFGNRMISLALRSVAAYFIGVFFYRGRQSVRLFVVLMFTAFTYISIQIGQGVELTLLYTVNQMAMRIDAMNNQVFIEVLIKVIYLLCNGIAIILPLFSAGFVVKNNRHNLNGRSAKEIFSYMMPVIMGSAASVILYFIFFMINENEHILNFDNYMEIYVFITAVFTAIYLAVLYSFKLQQDMIGMQEERTQKRVLENQILQMQNSMTEMESFYENVRHVKHDMKNQMEVMERLLEEKQTVGNEEINRYFEDMQKTLLNLEQKINTGNAVSDAVISSKFHYAKKEVSGIRLNAEDFMLTDKIHVRAYDIGIILNNGLDNAIEAVKRLRSRDPDAEVYIKIKSFWKQKMFFIEIENSFDGEIEWDNDGYPRSAKKDSRLHGIGLKNIRHCALKYMGDIDCTAKKDKFILSVMLKG